MHDDVLVDAILGAEAQLRDSHSRRDRYAADDAAWELAGLLTVWELRCGQLTELL